MSGLVPAGGDAPEARCSLCGRTAAGPCARCRRMVCGDCCELTAGGVGTFALCLTCVKTGGASVERPMWELVKWLAIVIVVIGAIAVGIALLRRHA